MDGVLVNTEPLKFQAYREVFKNRFNVELEDDPARLGKHEVPIVEFFLKKFGLNGNVTEVVRQKREAYYRILDGVSLELFPDVAELLRELQVSGMHLALATSSDRRSADTILKRFDLEKYFDVILTQEDTERKKPDPDIYLKSAARLKTDSGKCAVVEDSQVGVEAAKQAGMKCVAVTFTTERPFLNKADLIIDGFKQLTTEKIKNL